MSTLLPVEDPSRTPGGNVLCNDDWLMNLVKDGEEIDIDMGFVCLFVRKSNTLQWNKYKQFKRWDDRMIAKIINMVDKTMIMIIMMMMMIIIIKDINDRTTINYCIIIYTEGALFNIHKWSQQHYRPRHSFLTHTYPP